jgi:hypothetical protein
MLIEMEHVIIVDFFFQGLKHSEQIRSRMEIRDLFNLFVIIFIGIEYFIFKE